MTRLLIVAVFAASASAAAAQPVTVTLSEWKIGLNRDTVRAGSVTFSVKNTGSMTHGFFVLGEGVAKGSREIPAREEGTLTLTLKPGTYELYCPMSDMSHKAAGMTKKLFVAPGDQPAAPKKP